MIFSIKLCHLEGKSVFWDLKNVSLHRVISILPDVKFEPANIQQLLIACVLWQDLCHIAKCSLLSAVNVISRQRTPQLKVKKNQILLCFHFTTRQLFRPKSRVNFHPRCVSGLVMRFVLIFLMFLKIRKLATRTKIKHRKKIHQVTSRVKMFYNFRSAS